MSSERQRRHWATISGNQSTDGESECDGCTDRPLEVATPTSRPLSGSGCHALTWRSHGHSLAAYLRRHLRQTVVLPGKCTTDSALTG